MKNFKSLLLGAVLLPAVMFASETPDKKEVKNCSVYMSHTPTGAVVPMPAIGVRYQQNPFLSDTSLGGRYLPTDCKVMLLNFKHHFSFIFNQGAESQHYAGLGASVIWEHHFHCCYDEVSYLPFFVLGKDFTMNSGKKLFVECHYCPYVFGKDSQQLHVPELKLGCAF